MGHTMINESILDIGHERDEIKYKNNSVQSRPLSNPRLQHRLLAELDDLFEKIEDGTVKENTFAGCIALGRRDLPTLDENQSKQIKDVLLCTPVAAHPSAIERIPILSSMFHRIWDLFASHETNEHPARNSAESHSSLVDEYGRVKNIGTPSTDGDQTSQRESRDIQEVDVKGFLVAHGEDYTWALPYAWDIAGQLDAVKKSEADGDVALFLEKRRKLNVRRPKSTTFEQSVQRYAARISELYCDENGDITDEKSLEIFIRELIDTLLDKTKAYWPTSPLLAIFDGLIATVIRPLLYEHQTAHMQSATTTAAGVVISENMVGTMEKLATAPKWNKTSQRSVERYVEKAFKAHVCSFFMDRYAPYNRDYAKSPHPDAAALTDVGLAVKGFGSPIHLKNIMELLQPTSQADGLVEYVFQHFRSDAVIDH